MDDSLAKKVKNEQNFDGDSNKTSMEEAKVDGQLERQIVFRQ